MGYKVIYSLANENRKTERKNIFMKEYSLKKEEFNVSYKKFAKYIVTFFLVVPIIVYSTINRFANDSLTKLLIVLMILMVSSSAIVKFFYSFYKVRRDWYSFRILLSDDLLVKTQTKTPNAEIQIKEITRIIQLAGGVSIQSDDPQKFIFVPEALEEYQDLLIRLNKIVPIEVSPIVSVAVPAGYAIKQQVQSGDLLKKWLIIFACIIGFFTVVPLVVVIGLLIVIKLIH
ncbi:hypothetical protein [Paenibacillus radicis (ex Xue et al. 2023)]|uniref:PH domain-containing protein n=1 Tax=Paenibacillus radicis (ex Xue et al. 2023) TaxID=2972489 RepID=A0ABT1YD63_9BACL|nr:hypothetical protein [Paenibacillus radicis (ex Xue et al. 2023)]MCR8630867.1 hypothetical protein [Paenibacillus radicis (ex Xue et al. 2023)]